MGWATLAACLLAPIVAHGLWRPLAHAFGAAGTAQAITGAALAIALACAVAGWLGGGKTLWIPVLVGGVVTVALVVGLSLGVAGLGALVPVAGLTTGLVSWLPPRLPAALDGLARRHRLLTVLYLLVALVSVASTARLSIFIGDPTAVDDQVLPGEKFVEVHSCLTAYVRASELVRQGVENVYDDPWWHGSTGLPPLAAGVENPYRPFLLDNFSYPPTFLLLEAPLTVLEGDFLAQRALWFGLNGLLAALGMWVVARWITGPAAHRVVLLAPLFFGSIPVLLTLQIGNFHLAAMVLALLAMVAFDRQRAFTGGALLAVTILSKISPGVLGIVLLVQRRFREAVITAGFGLLLTVASALCFGLDSMRAFLTFALPRLSSGAAFPFMDTDAGIATNMAPFGFPFKLKYLGFDLGDPWHLGPHVAHVYTLGLVVLAVVGARRRGDRHDQAVRWMALLVLAAMQSPFAPAYTLIGLLWATTLLAVEVRRAWHAVALIALWPALLVVPQGLATGALAVLSIAHTVLAVGVCVWLVVRAPRVTEPSSPIPQPNRRTR